MKPGLADMKNAIVVPHIASASKVPWWICYCSLLLSITGYEVVILGPY